MSALAKKQLIEEDIELTIKLKNLTSDTIPEKSPRLISVADRGCSLELHNKSCSLGHQVLLSFLVKKADNKKAHPEKVIQIVGKVSEVTPPDSGNSEMTIQFTQFINEEWQFLLKHFEHKQEVLKEIVEKLK